MPIPGFNARERGELVHYALEHIWSELQDSIGLASIALMITWGAVKIMSGVFTGEDGQQVHAPIRLDPRADTELFRKACS